MMVEVSDLDLRPTDADVLSIVAGADPADESALMARIDGTGAGDAAVATAAFVSPGPDLSLRFQSGAFPGIYDFGLEGWIPRGFFCTWITSLSHLLRALCLLVYTPDPSPPFNS